MLHGFDQHFVSLYETYQDSRHISYGWRGSTLQSFEPLVSLHLMLKSNFKYCIQFNVSAHLSPFGFNLLHLKTSIKLMLALTALDCANPCSALYQNIKVNPPWVLSKKSSRMQKYFNLKLVPHQMNEIPQTHILIPYHRNCQRRTYNDTCWAPSPSLKLFQGWFDRFDKKWLENYPKRDRHVYTFSQAKYTKSIK